ncbi:MAG: hypothetical protein ACXIT4_09265 [Erythrobacter sp.]
MFDTLSDRLGGAFAAKVGTGFAVRKRDHKQGAFAAKVGTGFAVRKRDHKQSAAVIGKELRHV